MRSIDTFFPPSAFHVMLPPRQKGSGRSEHIVVEGKPSNPNGYFVEECRCFEPNCVSDFNAVRCFLNTVQRRQTLARTCIRSYVCLYICIHTRFRVGLHVHTLTDMNKWISKVQFYLRAFYDRLGVCEGARFAEIDSECFLM